MRRACPLSRHCMATGRSDQQMSYCASPRQPGRCIRRRCTTSMRIGVCSDISACSPRVAADAWPCQLRGGGSLPTSGASPLRNSASASRSSFPKNGSIPGDAVGQPSARSMSMWRWRAVQSLLPSYGSWWRRQKQIDRTTSQSRSRSAGQVVSAWACWSAKAPRIGPTPTGSWRVQVLSSTASWSEVEHPADWPSVLSRQTARSPTTLSSTGRK